MNHRRLRNLFAFLVLGGLLCYGGAFLFSGVQTRKVVKYVLPLEYVGRFQVNYGVPDTPPLPLVNDCLICVIPPSGTLRTSTAYESGTAKDEYYYGTVSKEGKIQGDRVDHLIQDGQSVFEESSEVAGTKSSEISFVGTRQDFENYGNNFRIGPVWKNQPECQDLPWGTVIPSSELPKDFSKTDFFRIALNGKTFRNCSFNYSAFVEVNLSGSDLQKSSFRKADLYSALLKRCDLREADFRGAILERADLREAKLEGARFEGATYDSRTVWPNGFQIEGKGAVNIEKATSVPFQTM